MLQVIDKNQGQKIEWRQIGTKLIFGEDDDLIINCKSRHRDWPVHADVCMDDDGNLVIGVGVGRYYVAQVDIPAIQYIDAPNPNGDELTIKRDAQLLDMDDVVLTLWSVDDFRRRTSDV